jgi:hypothetical protein
MTVDAGEIFKDLIAEYETAQQLREQSESPTPQFWMNNNTLHISALGPDGKTLLWLPAGGPPEMWV